MKRSTPLRRTPFKRSHEPTVQREQHPCSYTPATVKPLHMGVYAGRTSSAVPKREYVRSKALMQAYRLIPCQNCGVDDGTVCGAHSNWAEHGKAKSIKADDNRCASLCFTCHGMLDQGSILGAAERYALWTTAHAKTVRELTARGLWPAGVPVPEILGNAPSMTSQ